MPPRYKLASKKKLDKRTLELSIALLVLSQERPQYTLAVIVMGGLYSFNLNIARREPSVTARGFPTSMIGEPSGQQIGICTSPHRLADAPSDERLALTHGGSAASVCESRWYFRPKLRYCPSGPNVLHRKAPTAAFAPVPPNSSQSIKRWSLWTAAVSREFGHQHDQSNSRSPDGDC